MAKQKPAPAAPADADIEHIVPALRPLAVGVGEVFTDPKNERQHGLENMAAIKASLTKFGQDQPIVVQRQGSIVRKGNGRLQAARELGWKYIAAIFVDESDWEATARAIADNRSSELATWDLNALGVSMAALKETGHGDAIVGWTEGEVDALIQGVATQANPAVVEPPEEFPEFNEETTKTEHECPKCGYRWSGGTGASPARDAGTEDGE